MLSLALQINRAFITVDFDEFMMLPKCKQTADAQIEILNLYEES